MLHFYDMQQRTGTGISQPLQPNAQGSNLQTVSEQALIEQSVLDILGTAVGSRFDQPAYGSKLSMLIFEPVNEVLEALLEYYIEDALRRWEPRILLQDVAFEYPEERSEVVLCRISAKVNQTGQQEIYVYPFYRELDR